ncbi:MAG: non-homologous end-joining DNA ligase [Erysipelotrichales bacterium]|nr:non-homologous end-joining DNA ligase [Erysipelotrichales bacterium]
MSLNKYNKKRNFSSTSEPKGKIKKEELNRFVIQHHFSRKEHFDFRLEYGGALVSFAIPKGLSNEANEKRLAVHVEDHPVDYINFEGKIPTGNYGAGTVKVYDKGTYVPAFDMKKGFKKGHIKFYLNGSKYRGMWSLIKTEEPNWLIMKHEEKTKVEKRRNPFSNCAVKLAKLTDKIPIKNYIFEIKYDGYRIVAYCGSTIKLKTRNNLNYTKKFSSVVNSLKALNRTMILDGELVALDKKGRSDFSLLTDNIKKGIDNFSYVVFDILALDGKDLRNKPLIERKEILENVLKEVSNNIILSSYVRNKGKESFQMAQKLNLEGIIAKKIDSKYNGTRDEDWLKIKCYKRQEFVIGGYLTTEKNKELSAILVGYYEKNRFIFIGKVGTGFDKTTRNELAKKFKSRIRKTSPFETCDISKEVIWLKPELVAEIQFSEITKNGLLRQPSFLGLRKDKKAKDVKLEYERN